MNITVKLLSSLLPLWITLLMSGLFTVGCASSAPLPVPEQETAVSPPPLPVDEQQETSRVLGGAKKCPKNAKLVNGKCTLQVETTE